MTMTLVIGNKNYSSWSLRPWLLMTAYKLPFTEKLESLHEDNLSERLAVHSPSARVPVLIDDQTVVWDSLAICEYINEEYLEGIAWPKKAQNRALARAITCEMHAGFNALRNALPMNIRATRSVVIDEAVKKDIQRIDDIWSNHQNNEWLFGQFGIADCFYAPVALRFITYDIKLSEQARIYQQRLLNHPALRAWVDAAITEQEIIFADEAGSPIK